LTLGDFWGIRDEALEKYIPNGISFVMPNSGKGEALFQSIGDRLEWVEHPLGEAVPQNRCLLEPAPEGTKRNEFFEKLKHKDFRELMEEY
jgi:hypothetical protein